MEAIWDYIFKKHLCIHSREHPMMIADRSFSTPDRREAALELAFSKFNAPAVFLGRSPVLAAFSVAKQTALVVDSGA